MVSSLQTLNVLGIGQRARQEANRHGPNDVISMIFLNLPGWSQPNAFHVCITSYKIALQDQRAFKRMPWHFMVHITLNTSSITYSNRFWTKRITSRTVRASAGKRFLTSRVSAVCFSPVRTPLSFYVSTTIVLLTFPNSFRRDAAAELSDGAVVAASLSHAARLSVSLGVSRVVFQPPQHVRHISKSIGFV